MVHQLSQMLREYSLSWCPSLLSPIILTTTQDSIQIEQKNKLPELQCGEILAPSIAISTPWRPLSADQSQSSSSHIEANRSHPPLWSWITTSTLRTILNSVKTYAKPLLCTERQAKHQWVFKTLSTRLSNTTSKRKQSLSKRTWYVSKRLSLNRESFNSLTTAQGSVQMHLGQVKQIAISEQACT